MDCPDDRAAADLGNFSVGNAVGLNNACAVLSCS